jgi:hypothetical protein
MKLRAPASDVTVPPPGARRRRGPWRPADEPYVLLKCGHDGILWGAIVNLRGTVKDAYCETCQDWVKIGRKKHIPKSQELPISPPF